ncbi:hypothetical protein LJB76_00300 [Clostridia bacterium OttesenSCG-928-O13]|nr:hypothetical protein [Clostridia bacterium OttesenSCG-928-O13]
MNGTITVETQTTKMKPGEKHSFHVRFNNMEPCKLRFELTDYNSGTITEEGEYTAPDREGSFEVRILCSDHPDIATYAYVDVRA